jgi:hypothetical protein
VLRLRYHKIDVVIANLNYQTVKLGSWRLMKIAGRNLDGCLNSTNSTQTVYLVLKTCDRQEWKGWSDWLGTGNSCC